MYMSLPKGVKTRFGRDKVLKLHKNIYCQKKAGWKFDIYAHENLENIGWEQSKVSDCVFYKQGCKLIMYVDSQILLHKSDQVINNEINLMKEKN